ncbi:DUF7344 domain-containing protein [Halopiger goleimassiliensis]|uniref:DUF7344 domain-containing protein n=1 Tax=Halopiger goleimassiliensis TaxID=1293048 RepID=UPI000677A459|nr:hypothetical protein [Halopiger goleimassiliensis]
MNEEMRSETVDRVYDLLSHRRRRRLLYLLLETDRRSVENVAHRLAVVESEDSTDAEDEDARRRLAISLHHDHLPRLEEYGIIEYDVDRRTIAVADGFDEIRPFVERARASEGGILVTDVTGDTPTKLQFDGVSD